ncbi:hypothetical protein X975_13955, partial [Stegodyphus mimosarum]
MCSSRAHFAASVIFCNFSMALSMPLGTAVLFLFTAWLIAMPDACAVSCSSGTSYGKLVSSSGQPVVSSHSVVAAPFELPSFASKTQLC